MAKGAWERIKAAEKAERAGKDTAGEAARLLDDVPRALPGLMAAVKLQRKASKVGFDWNDPYAVLAKMREELDEVEETLATDDVGRQKEEIGDLLFAIANLARHLDVEPESALRSANEKFRRRFAYIEANIARTGHTMESADLDTMEALWVEAKNAAKPDSRPD
jgi:ATP diphosphatase